MLSVISGWIHAHKLGHMFALFCAKRIYLLIAKQTKRKNIELCELVYGVMLGVAIRRVGLG